ncbi:hypothetical protein [Agrobacterium pusense]|uniref:hypothetical protein n=1 Tax=Agrobacterium pusense TaxID=648995 RepID=UPI000D1BF637|nr:hypothetical protein [Agrobacterium pusense]
MSDWLNADHRLFFVEQQKSMDDNEKLALRPMPPEELSIRASTKKRWEHILSQWRRGWHSDSAVERLNNYLEYHRVRIFEEKNAGDEFDWEADWLDAVNYHDLQQDFVRNRRAYNEGLHKMWTEWHDRSVTALEQLALETLRSMVIVNGAAILACLTILSGQIDRPNPSAVLAAKIMLFGAIISLAMIAGGHLISSMRMIEVTSRIRAVLVGHVRHRRLYSIFRYTRRFLNPTIDTSNALIYGSIFVFAASAVVCAVILGFDVGYRPK